MSAKEAAREIGISYKALLARARRGTIDHQRAGWGVLLHRDVVKQVKQNVNRNKNLGPTTG